MTGDSLKLRERPGRTVALIASAVLLLGLLIPALISSRARSLLAEFPSPSNSPGISETVEVSRAGLKKILLLDGELRAVRSRTIYGSATEDVKIVYLPPEGTVVRAGERIVELDSTSILTRIKDIEERIVAAENEIVKVRAQHESALRDLEVELSKLKLAFEQAKLKAKIPAEVLARREYQDAQLAHDKTRTEYENQMNKIEQKKKEQAAELQVKIIEKDKLQLQLDRATASLSRMKIAAPADGMVIYNDHYNERRKIQVGDVIWGGFPIVRLPDLTAMEVIAAVNEVDGPRISIGSKASIKLDSYPEMVIGGEVKDISQTAVKASWMAKARIFRVIISLDRTLEEVMKPGMSAQVSIEVSESSPQLIVPRSSISFDGEKAKVTRLEGGAILRDVAVTLLAGDALSYQVADNGALKVGDRILLRQTVKPN